MIRMLWRNLLAVLLTTCLLTPTTSYKILCLFPHVAKSHFLMAEALMKGLAAKGHQVTMISNFPQEKPLPNYRDISLVGSMPEFVNKVPLDTLATGYVHTTINFLAYMGYVNCENTLEFPAMKKFIASNEKFDLIVTELFNTDCMLGYIYKTKTPFIALTTSVMMPWAHARFGNPDNPAYMGNHFVGHGYEMNFVERLKNVIYQEGLKILYYYMFDKPAHELVKKHFGEDVPPLDEIAKNTSLLLTNSHFTLNRPRPLVPNVVEDIKKFLDEAKNGVIYFSLGSSVRADTFTEEKRDAFIQAFKELPQRVLWKWESKTLPGKPDNVFITHGGLMGTMESAYSGVPMVGIPLFGDQFHNVRCYEEEGIATKLDYHTISKQTVLAALKTILDNPRHMRTAAVDLPLYQYLLLDVIAVLLLALLVGLAVPCFIMKKLFSICCGKSNSNNKQKKKAKKSINAAIEHFDNGFISVVDVIEFSILNKTYMNQTHNVFKLCLLIFSPKILQIINRFCIIFKSTSNFKQKNKFCKSYSRNISNSIKIIIQLATLWLVLLVLRENASHSSSIAIYNITELRFVLMILGLNVNLEINSINTILTTLLTNIVYNTSN
ncbi:hypothetical protein C0J52_02524 [Blattella germanica]|nr:hypothetical protein C0J52_02524 [Blattella germanica]